MKVKCVISLATRADTQSRLKKFGNFRFFYKSGSGKLNFHDFYIQLRGAVYEDLTTIKSGIFYRIKISKKLSNIICFMQNHELLVFYCGHQSKVHRQKWVSTNRQLIVANLIYITLVFVGFANVNPNRTQ